MVLGVAPTGYVTARALGERFPLEGTRVTDASGALQGRVQRVFGPVARPYLSVRLKRPLKIEEGVRLVGSPLLRA